ncbi:hypothetical protein P3T76_007253 [Phytophthora citrophthora]|uniref:BZIP domain-containing protein n=1 Tax=Phytophthora citrophthora TaxID=4793 RepID=A0AAD9GMN7_9STRA|nr:hypothetical protein P3T76_007253 [Phytophthora citrophthora]
MSSVTESPFSVNDFMDLLGDDSPTELSSLDVGTTNRKELKKARHRKEMIKFRLNKKNKQKKLIVEHQRLQRDMKVLVDAMKETAASSDGQMDALQELVVERESLRNENLALLEELKRYEKFKSVLLEASEDPMEKEESNLLATDDAGWRVTLDGEGEESFYFHPFTRGQVDAEMQRFETELTDGMASLSMAGTFFGWKVYRAPLVASVLDSSRLIARTRVTKRLRCSLDVHTQMSYTKQKDISPMIVTPIGWGLHHRGATSTQVLQEFDQDSLVFVHNIPGPERSLRYLFQVGRAQWKLLDGRRKLTASLAIIDSDANRRSRDADNTQDRVEWAYEGGIQVSIIEIDEDSIDVTCDHWASCESPQHAEYLMIQWTQFAVWWEQLTVPFNLLLNTPQD